VRAAPQLPRSFGIGVEPAAELLIVVGDDPERMHSEAALAKVAGMSPVSASSAQKSG
jgi:transposase